MFAKPSCANNMNERKLKKIYRERFVCPLNSISVSNLVKNNLNSRGENDEIYINMKTQSIEYCV